MRRRILSDSGLKASLIQHENVVAGDVVFYDSSSETMIYYRLGEGSESIPESCTPIGVVVIPSSHNVYGNGACGVMSLKEMDYTTPDTGSTSYQSIYWGYKSLDISNLTNYNVVCHVGNNGTVNESVEGTTGYAFLPSDKFTTVKNPYDTDTYYNYNDSDYYIPSPYNDDDTRNPAYYQTSSPSSTANAMSDFNGVNNTNIITALATTESWKTASSITNSYSIGYYPAACCCWRYHTDGTSQGDWYLPACGELGYIMPKFNQIQTSINALRSAYGDSVGVQLKSNDAYWSSSEYSSDGARYVGTLNGRVDSSGKGYYAYVRAWLQVGGKEKNYGPIHISGGTATDIPASGGSSSATGYTYSQTWGWGDSTTDGGVITEGAEVSVTSVEADSLGTTITDRTKVGTSRLTVTMNGVTATKDYDVYLAANVATYGNVSVTSNGSASDIPAAGGTVAASGGAGSQTVTYTSGAERAGTVTVGTYNTVSANSLGTTEKVRTAIGDSVATLTGEGGKEATARVAVYLQANGATLSSISAWASSCTNIPTSYINQVDWIAAGGGTIYGYCQANYTWTSTSTSTANVTSSTTWTHQGNYGSISGNAFTAPSRGTTTGDNRYNYIYASYGGKSSSFNTGQQYNSATYGNVTVTSHGSASDIPAGGGTIQASGGTGSLTVSFTSGATRAGSVSCGAYSGVSANSLGSTVKSRTHIGNSTATLTGEGGKTAGVSVAVYQAANAVTNANYQAYNGSYWASCSIGSGISAGGGSATVSKSAGHTYYYRLLYTSGTVMPSTTTYYSSELSDNCTIAIVTNGNSRFSLSGTTLSHSSMTTNETTDTCTVRCTNSASTSATKDASVSVTNSKSVTGTSGGVTTWGNVTAGTITNATVPASGGTRTATAGNGSQSWSKTAIVTSYKYTSGSTSSATTTAASNGTNSIAPSVASISATGSNLGTTVKAAATLKSLAVTWSGNGSKSASGTMYVYQLANAVTSRVNQSKSITASSTSVSASASTVTLTTSVSTKYTYTSTTSTTTGEPHTVSITANGANATLSGTTTSTGNSISPKLSIPANSSTGTRSVTVQVKGSETGATATVTITQESNYCYISIYNNTDGIMSYYFGAGKSGTISEWNSAYVTVTKGQAGSVAFDQIDGSPYFQIFSDSSGNRFLQQYSVSILSDDTQGENLTINGDYAA